MSQVNVSPVVDGLLRTPHSDRRGTLSKPWADFYRQVGDAVNRSPQLTSVPANPQATGRPGQMALDDSFLYLCVSKDKWVRFPKDSQW